MDRTQLATSEDELCRHSRRHPEELRANRGEEEEERLCCLQQAPVALAVALAVAGQLRWYPEEGVMRPLQEEPAPCLVPVWTASTHQWHP